MYNAIVSTFVTSRLPQSFLDRLDRQFGPTSARAIVKAFGEKRLPTLRANTLKTSDEAVMESFRSRGIQFERVRGVPHAFRIRNRTDEQLLEDPLCLEGKIYLQGVSSMLPPIVLDSKPGESVLDLCAAPGSKTSQIAAMMSGKGEIVAFEENEIRVQKLQNTLAMQGANAIVRHEDAALAQREYTGHFDKVLADVPCSAEGRISTQDGRSFGFWSEKNITAHAKLQRRLLKSAVACLKSGGVLVYSTCTLAPEENALQVDWVLGEFPQLKTERVDVPLSQVRVHANRSVTVLPTVEHEGLFIARFRST